MKRTERDKALIEFGEMWALASFYKFNTRQRGIWKSLSEWHHVRNSVKGGKERIVKAWEKRKACKKERNCSNCGRCVVHRTYGDDTESGCQIGGYMYINNTDAPNNFVCNYWIPEGKEKK